MQDLIYQINKKNNLAKFKINFKNPIDVNFVKIEKIKKIDGITISKEKRTGKIKSIYSTLKLNFGYYSEYGKNPFSKFILTLISNWEEVYNIEFEKKVSLDDLELINPFHWFMEFSKVFNPKSEQDSGYDIVIGNPPFVRIENIDEPERELYKRNFELAEKRFDLFILFYEICNTLVKIQGYLCLVSSNKFLKSQTAENMRKFIKSNFSIREIIY